MRVLILGLNYLPESTSIGPYTADLAEYLQGCGHQVRVVTGFPMAPQWKIWEGYRRSLFRREIINGVPVQRTWLYVPSQPRRASSRILFDLSFTLSAFIGGLFAEPCDLVVAVSPPLQLGLTGWLLSRLKSAKFFLHLQDLVPDAAVATGMLPENSRAVKIARALEKFIYSRADSIGVICEGFARNLAHKGVPAEKLARLPNYIDLNFLKPFPRYNSFREQHQIGAEQFVVMYSGSIALKQGLNVLVEAAAELRDQPNIRFYLIGEGPYLPDLQKRAEELGLNNFHFLPLQPREGLPQQLAAADALLITQKQAVTDIVFPGKLLYYAAAARPIIAAVSAESETGRFIADRQIGLVVPPETPQALAGAILKLYREGIGQYGERGRQVASEEFDRRVVLQRFSEHLEAVATKFKKIGSFLRRGL
jgi:colanic acid biosynthesis glycosyl transferase WcaI